MKLTTETINEWPRSEWHNISAALPSAKGIGIAGCNFPGLLPWSEIAARSRDIRQKITGARGIGITALGQHFMLFGDEWLPDQVAMITRPMSEAEIEQEYLAGIFARNFNDVLEFQN